MATGKQGFVRAGVPQHSVSAQREGETCVQAPLTAMYIQTLPGLRVPVMCANPAMPLLTLQVSSRMMEQQQRPEVAAASLRPKAAGKHVCLHCGRDCLKPSVLEKHLRCHTGERPYPCTTCGISFKTQSNLYKHKRTQAHARLSSESGKSTLSSQESTDSSRETCSSPPLELQSEDLADGNGGGGGDGGAATSTKTVLGLADPCGRAVLQTDWASGKAAVGLDASPAEGQQESLSTAGQRRQLSSEDMTESSSMQMESPTRAPSTPNRTPLQRQKALFPTLSRGKTQSHGSTDSGFSEGSEPNFTSSPGASLHDPSMESVAESNMELQEPGSSRTLSGVTHEDDKSKVSVQEKQKLEEHILKLISDNSMLMDDRHLLNMRPRKTVLSKQGSIDLPMPYTYKDSFHFEMRSSKHQDSSSPKQDRRGRAIYSSVPTQYSASLEHAPLTRSSSLPFSVGTQNSERTASPCPGGSVPLGRRCSAGNICTFTSVDQHPPGHRLLVRQAAVDCLAGMEASPNHSSLSSDGDCTDGAVESAAKKWRRKKGQKFAYNKWYMYGGGTFKKLYDTETSIAQKNRMPPPSMEPAQSQGIQTSQQRESSSAVSSCSAACLPPAVNVLPAQTHSQVISSYVLLQSQLINQTAQPLQPGLANQNAAPSTDLNNETGGVKGTEAKSKGLEMQLSNLIPPERKKQKTVDDHSALIEKTDTLMNQRCLFTSGSRQSNLNVCDVTNQSLQPVCADLFQRSSASELQKDSRLNLHRQGSLTSLPPSNQRQLVFKRHSSPLFMVSKSGRSGCPSVSSVTSPAPQVKQSFPPMYQLKIPCFTDGASDSHHRNAPSPKLPSSSHTPAQQGACETSSLSVPQSQPATGLVSRGQEQQGTVTKPLASPVRKEQNANALTKAEAPHQPSSYLSVISATPTLVSSTSQSEPANTLVQNQSTPNTIHNMPAGSVSSVLSHPVQTFTPLGHSQSVTVSTTHSTVSLLSHSSTATKTSQIHTVTAASAERSSTATSVSILKKPLDTHIPVSQSSMDSDSLGINQSELQESKSEDKTFLGNDSLQSLTQGMFYVRTADLQIFMQLISDEQLALIEPQIETQDFKLPGSHSFPHQDSETLQPNTVQTSISQEIHKQCSDNTITKPGLSEGDMNNSASSKILDRISLSDVATEQQNSTESAKDANSRCPENIDLTKTGPHGVISSSKTANCTSAPLDSKMNPLGQQCKSHHVSVVPKELESAGCIITVRSHPDQSPGEPLGGVPLADEPTAKPGSGPMPRSSPTHESSSLCVSAVREGEQHCRVTVSHPGAVNTSVASLNRPGASTEKTPVSLKEKTPFCPDIPVLSDKCQLENCQAALTTTGQLESCYPPAGKSESIAGEVAEADAEAEAEVSCVQEDLLLPPASLSLTVSRQKELLCAAQPSQHELCQAAFTTPVPEDCGMALVPTPHQHQSSNQSAACGGDECDLTYEARGNETCSPVQAPGQHLPQQDPCSQREDVMWSDGKQGTVLTARTARVSPGRRAPNRTPEGRVKCGGSTGGIEPANQDPDTGRWLCGLTQNLQLHWEAEMGFQGWVPQEHKTGKEENKKEEPPGTPEGKQSSRKPHPHLSQQVTNAHDCTPASCGTTSLSHHVPAPCQRESNPLINSEQVRESGGASSKAMQELISANVAKDSDRVPLGCHKRLTSSPAGYLTSACGHSPSESVIQKEVQKETHVKNTASQSHSKSSHLSEHKQRGTAEFSVATELCVTLSPCNTATSGAVNITPADPNCPSPNPANSYAIHSKLTCISTTHSKCAEPHASQCQLSGSYLEEEGTSSSSDDEGKLVIELE